MTDTRGSQRGMSLVELLVVIVIVAILASVAFPSYRAHVIKANRSAAKNTLMQVAARQENFFADNKAYTTDVTDLGYSADPLYVDENGEVVAAADSIYAISLSQTTTYNYTATATAQNAQADDGDCATLTINSVGTRSGTSANCW